MPIQKILDLKLSSITKNVTREYFDIDVLYFVI